MSALKTMGLCKHDEEAGELEIALLISLLTENKNTLFSGFLAIFYHQKIMCCFFTPNFMGLEQY